MLKSAARADVPRGSLASRVTAKHQTLDDICDIGALTDEYFVFHAEIATCVTLDRGRSDRTDYGRWGDRGVGTSDRERDLLWGVWSVHGL